MITVAGGDSFIFGSELVDCPNGAPSSYSRSTFTALLADGRYVCTAYPGNSNRQIVVAVKQACERLVDVGVIVCWTWPSRDNKIDSDSEIIDLETYLKFHNIPYMFTCADNCIVTGKLDYSNWYMFPPATEEWNTMSPRGFYQWAVENKYTVGPDNHPLEQAHQDAAQLIKDKFNEVVKKHLQQNHARNSIS
jgi:hypothetical protein